jgi:hypothetical protein
MVGVLKTSNRSKGAGQLMIALLLIAMAAGCASALMFASIISGALISLVLFWLAPLPLMVAALGWGPLCATVGGIGAATGLGLIFGLPFCIAFALSVAFPAWRLGHLALLRRSLPAATPADDSTPVEWYSVGRLLLWIAAFAAVTTTAALLTLGSDASTITEAMSSALNSFFLSAAGVVPSDSTIHALVTMAPIAAVIATMTTLTLNLWLAAKITATSGRLSRPWPDLKGVDLPPMTLAALSVALAFCFTDGLLAIVAQIATSALMMAYALTGFAVLHTVTLAWKGRAFWLGGIYATVVAFNLFFLAIVALGLSDSIFGLRHRYWQRRLPLVPTP